MRRAWQKALTVFLVVCIGLTPVGEPLSRAYPADASVMGEPAGIEAGQEPVSKVGPDSEERSMPPNVVSDEAGTPQRQPPPVPVPTPEVQPQATKVYTPSGIPIEDLPPRHPLINLNLRLPAQDPDVVGQRIAATLREHKEKRELAPKAALQSSAEIQALAAGLDNDPRLIYEYVHNNFDFVPTWGLLKSPRETYLAKAGNPFDQAALLVALLQAAGYEAEFVFGLIQIPLDQAMNWVGVTNPQVLPHVFWNGGIPAEVQDDVLRMNHIWARVRIDGAWYPLDPSFKAYAYNAGIDLATVLGYDRSAFLAAAESGSTITADYVRRINETNINSHLIQYSNNLINYLRTNTPFAYLEDVIGGREIVPETLDGYPTQLPYTVESSWGETPEMPDDYMYKLHIEVPGIDYWANLPDVAGERTTIFYVGATPADQATIDDADGIYNVYPAYQVNMKPELRVGGELVATGDPLSLGSWEPITVTIVTPIGDWTARYAPQWLRAGEWYAFPMMLQTVSPEALRRHHKALVESRAAGLADDSEPVLGQSLYNIGLSYFNQVDASDHVDAQIAEVVLVPHFSGMLMSQDLAVLEWDWISGEWKPMRLGPASYTIDVRLVWSSVLSASGDTDRERGFMTDSGHKGSAIEHATIEQLQNNPSLSTIQVLDIANDDGLKIYHIISSTVDAILPLLDYPTYIKDSLRDDVEAGYEVTVPEGNITYNQWTGTGWISFNPRSGSAGYWLNGSIGDVPGDYGMPSIRRGGQASVTDDVDTPELIKETKESVPPKAELPPENQAEIVEPVNAVTGAFYYSHNDVAFGERGLPVAFSRTYNSGANQRQGPLGYGWVHAYAMHLSEGSKWSEGFGGALAIDATAGIVEAYVGVDIASTGAGALPHFRLVIGSEASDWILDQMIDNVMTAIGPDGMLYQYLLLSDGTYYPCPGTYSELTDNGDGMHTIRLKNGVQLHFDATGRLSRQEDANGNATTLTYDGDGQLIRVTDAVGRSVNLSYQGEHLTQITDPAGRTFRYQYDTAGDLVSYTDAAGRTTRYEYDGAHRMTVLVDANGNRFVENSYDTFGRVHSQTDGRGGVATLRYGDGRVAVTDPLGQTTIYRYDHQGRVVAMENPLGEVTSWTYDARGNVARYTDPRGESTNYEYDGQGNLIRIVDRLGHTRAYTYDAADNQVSSTDPLGHTSQFTYDSHKNMTASIDPLGNVSSFSYDSHGQLVEETDARGHQTMYTYDAYGNVTTVTDPLGNSSTSSYDILGRKTSSTDANGHTTRLEYDLADNLIRITNPLGDTTAYTFDGNNQVTNITDPLGNVTRFTHDPLFNLTTVTDADGQMTRYTYDANNNLIGETDAEGHHWTYRVDAVGRVVESIDPLGRSIQSTYDSAGNLIAETRADGSIITYQRDENGRLASVGYPDGSTVTYRYDADGNLVEAAYGAWHLWYTLDALGRVVSVRQENPSYALAYTYDEVGNLQRMVMSDGPQQIMELRYEYDARNKLTRLTDVAQGHEVTYAYDAIGNLLTTDYFNGTQTTYTYDANDQVTEVTSRATSGQVMSAFAYTYDANGNLIRAIATTPGGSHVVSYVYNSLNQLVGETYPRYEVAYAWADEN